MLILSYGTGKTPGYVFALESEAGWPRVVTYPGLPRIRTCPMKAYGSSSHGLAYGRHTEWMAIAGGSG